MIQEKDVVMAISYSGATDELLRFIPLLLDRKIPIIGMSGNPESLLAQYSTCHINIAVEREADPLNLAPTSSTTVTLAVGDALACALIKKRDFKPIDFAQYHPGGSLGKRLLSRVKDYMVSTNLPIVAPNDKVSDTIIEISKHKFGLAIVKDGDSFVGVVSDGDVRRAMQNKKEQFFNLRVKEIMTTTPKSIDENAKIEEASILMRNHNIHTLVIVNSYGNVVGLIDAFACM
jgi:arabinose-5-phosphate isomerase